MNINSIIDHEEQGKEYTQHSQTEVLIFSFLEPLLSGDI